MRIIRTEIYFDKGEFDSRADVPGVSVAWIQGDAREGVLSDANGFPAPGEHNFGDISLNAVPAYALEKVLPDIVQRSLFGALSGGENVSMNFVEYILGQPVVIERSPPVWIKLKDVVDSMRKDPRAVGAFVGMVAGYEHPPFMLLTVPAGIFLIGSAPAITTAIQRGLVKLINDFFDKH